MNPSTPLRALQRASRCKQTFQHTVQSTPAWQTTCRHLHRPTAPPSLLRNATLSTRFRQQPRLSAFQQQRHEATATAPSANASSDAAKPDAKQDVPSYEMTFTCKKCLERSAHRMSKQAYHHGTVLITCPGCKARHLIADHLKVSPERCARLAQVDSSAYLSSKDKRRLWLKY